MIEMFRTFVQYFGMKGGEKEGYETDVPMHEQEEEEELKQNFNVSKYLAILQQVANLQQTSVLIDLDDMAIFSDHAAEFAIDNDGNNNDRSAYLDLVERITRNTGHYLTLFSEVLDELLPSPTVLTDMASMQVTDVLASHRRARLHQQAELQRQPADQNNSNTGDNLMRRETQNTIPALLLRRFDLFIKPRSVLSTLAVRQIGAPQVGGLVRVRAIVTRVSEVRPLLQVGTYTCEQCGHEVYQEVTSSTFLPLPQCPSERCRANGVRGQLVLQTRGSKFQRHQEARIQELTDQVPMGHIPRGMNVVLVSDLVRTVQPGDQVVLAGIFLPRPYTGFKAMKAGLLTDTYLYAQHIQPLKPRYSQVINTTDAQVDPLVEELARDAENSYERLAQSIAPEIYGHGDVKKALLLLLVGGVAQETADGMRIRGDINACLMGDPGVAKSQLLKYITQLAPRAVYTTGKGSSGVGLTAAVTKDAVTGEMVLEGGALVLADHGICCIDEFDKMDDSDRTAIHEVMEQQTISISKAGITTTLNARTSILAAANPLYGRYNPRKSPRENINLPPALLSRFDLLFLILDTPDQDSDTRLAQHVCQVHSRHGGNGNESSTTGGITSDERREESRKGNIDNGGIPSDIFRAYIALAKQYEPVVPSSLVEYAVGAYVGLRLNDLNNRDTTYTTPRTLLAVLRLAQARARLRLSQVVSQADLEEALRLMEVSRSSIDVHLDRSSARNRQSADPVSQIVALIRELARELDCKPDDNSNNDDGGCRVVPMDRVRELIRGRGFTDQQLQQCLVALDECHVWSLSPDGVTLRIFN